MIEKWVHNKPDLESRSITSFRDKDANFLPSFANDMKMSPLVAFFVVFQRKEKEQGKNSAFLFLIGLDDLEDMRDDKEISYVLKHVDENTTGFSFKFGGTNEYILNELCRDSRVTWFKMEIDDYKIADTYNLNRKKTNTHLTSEHWKKQQGTFGEYFALWHLGKNHNMRGFHVDSVGADIVLFDPDSSSKDNKFYAVSVKTFTYDNSLSYQFEKKHEEKLIAYSKKWNLSNDDSTTMQPMVCFNCVKYNEEGQISKIYMIAFEISHIEAISDKRCIYRTYGGITIRYDKDSINAMKIDKGIIFSEISFNNVHYYMSDN